MTDDWHGRVSQPTHLGNAVETRHTIYHDAGHASYRLAPIIPR